jgi:hypothetical protein
MKIINEQENDFESRYLVQRAKINEALNSVEDDEDEDFLRYQASSLLQQKLNFYDNRDLEKDLFTLGTIVQFLSSLESTLYSIYKKLKQIDINLSNIQDVCKRDKGIIKYLKYFEKELINNPKPLLIGTSDFQKLHQWITFRNNIVHNNNDLTPELKQVIVQWKLNIGDNKGKFIFNEHNIRDLADICGKTLDVFIDKVLSAYFINTGALDVR